VSQLNHELCLLLGGEKVRLQPWVNPHIFIYLVFHFDVLLLEARAAIRIIKGKDLRIGVVDASPGVNIVLEPLQPVEGLSEAVIIVQHHSSVFCKDVNESNLIDCIDELGFDVGPASGPFRQQRFEFMQFFQVCRREEVFVVSLSDYVDIKTTFFGKVLTILIVKPL
jgi:hypothetical protein